MTIEQLIATYGGVGAILLFVAYSHVQNLLSQQRTRLKAEKAVTETAAAREKWELEQEIAQAKEREEWSKRERDLYSKFIDMLNTSHDLKIDVVTANGKLAVADERALRFEADNKGLLTRVDDLGQRLATAETRLKDGEARHTKELHEKEEQIAELEKKAALVPLLERRVSELETELASIKNAARGNTPEPNIQPNEVSKGEVVNEHT